MTEPDTSARGVLQRRARQLARPIVHDAQTIVAGEHDDSVLVVRLGDERVGIALDHTIEVHRALELTPIPGARPPVVGAIAWRGRVLTVLDIAHTSRGPVVLTGTTRILVLGRGNPAFGIVADDVEDVQILKAEDINPVENAAPGRREFIRGITGGAVVVLDVAALIARFAPNQQSTGVPRE